MNNGSTLSRGNYSTNRRSRKRCFSTSYCLYFISDSYTTLEWHLSNFIFILKPLSNSTLHFLFNLFIFIIYYYLPGNRTGKWYLNFFYTHIQLNRNTSLFKILKITNDYLLFFFFFYNKTLLFKKTITLYNFSFNQL